MSLHLALRRAFTCRLTALATIILFPLLQAQEYDVVILDWKKGIFQ